MSELYTALPALLILISLISKNGIQLYRAAFEEKERPSIIAGRFIGMLFIAGVLYEAGAFHLIGLAP